MQVLSALPFYESLVSSGSVASSIPVFEFEDDGRWGGSVRAEEYDIAPRRRGGQLVLQSEMTAAAEVQMERLEGRGLEDPTQGAERVLPGLRLLRPVSACESLELSDQACTVGLHSRSKVLDRNDHEACSGSVQVAAH